MGRKDRNRVIIELREYLERWAWDYNSQPLHLLDINKHISKINEFQKELDSCKN